MTITNKQCADFGNTIRAKVEEFYAPRIAATQSLIDTERAAGRDPTQYNLQDGMVIVNLVLLLERIEKMKVLGLESAAIHESSCDTTAVPEWIGDAQKVSDIAMGIAMLPLILLTGNMAAAHVDLGEIYNGKVFGGDNAFLPKIRDDVLDFLQIGGDVRILINDPFNATKNFVSGALEDLREFIEKPFG